MSYWLELHCDERRGGSAPGSVVAGCYDLRGDQPGVMASELSRVMRALRGLTTDAKKGGWQKRGTRWLCPWCSSIPPGQEGEGK